MAVACGGDGDGGSASAGGPGSSGAPGHTGGASSSDAGAAGANETTAGDGGEPSSSGGAPGNQGGVGGEATGGSGTSGAAGAAAAAGAAGAPVLPPSCSAAGAGLACGSSSESCCTSLPIPGGQFYRSYDAVTFVDQTHPASITGFGLDKYEVTVGRFRKFVSAVVGSWRPASGDGKRADVNLGKGLANVGPAGGNEAGWNEAWNTQLASSALNWKTNLSCSTAATWTEAAGKNERLPINCVNWYEALAFCIWDEARLPSEAEWNDAASGGMQQRVFPWSSPAVSQTIDCAHANYHGALGPDYCTLPGAGGVNAVGSESPLGDGRWGHADLSGNVFEWVLDWYAPYTANCPDCVYFEDLPNHVIRGGGYANDADFLLSAGRRANGTADRAGSIGLRCAR